MVKKQKKQIKNKDSYRRRKNIKEVNLSKNFKIYWSFVSKYKWAIFWIMFFGLLIESSFVFINFLFKLIIDKGIEVEASNLLRAEFISFLLFLAVIYLGILVVRAFLRWYSLYMLHIVESKSMTALKNHYFKHILGLDYNFHTSHKTGSLISRLVRSSSALERMTDVIVFNMVPLVFSIIIVGLSLGYFGAIYSIIIFTVAILFVSYSVILQNKQRKHESIAILNEDIEKGNLSDFLTNVDSIKYYGKENRIENRFNFLTNMTRLSFFKAWNFHNWIAVGQSTILSLGTLFIVWVSIIQFLDGEITIGTLAFIYTTYSMMIGPLFSFVGGLKGFYKSMIDFDDLFQYGDFSNEIENNPGAKNLKIKNGDIEFRNMDFKYGKRAVFEDFNLKIKKNEKVALVGHSGCGKTTLVKLLYRFHNLNRGSILIDGIDTRNFKQETLRSELSIVPQECVLFDDTIFNNIAFSKPGATREEVFAAIKFAQLDEVIEDFPEKERTIVGERGVRLSGGEKQRVSIARAILANKKVLVLDEATSSLDSETEYEIQKDLKKLMKGRTSIIIAHRLSTIMNADKIVVMRKGKIIQIGTHNQLIKKPGEYRKLWNLQKGGYLK